MAFSRKWKIPFSRNYNASTPLGRHLVLLTMHKTRLQITRFNREEKLQSARWIMDHGFYLPEPLRFADGKLLGAEYDD